MFFTYRNKLRRRNPQWSRPLSASLASSFIGERFSETIQPPKRKILVIGGDRGYIPDWMSDNFEVRQLSHIPLDLEDELHGFVPDLILAFVRAERPNRPTKDTINRAKNYARGDNSRHQKVPYITINKGWSHVMYKALSMGLNWLRNAYPHNIWVPPQDLLPKPPRPETAARDAHNRKRAIRFQEKGVTPKHIQYAQIKYVNEQKTHCVLCDRDIEYQFRLLFDVPGQPEPIIFYPIGSTCITDWMDALPETPAKQAVQKQLELEFEKAELAHKTSGQQLELPFGEKRKSYLERRQAQSRYNKQANAQRKAILAKRKEERRRKREQRNRESDTSPTSSRYSH